MLKIILASTSLLLIPMMNPKMQWPLTTFWWFMISGMSMCTLFNHSFPYPVILETMMTDFLSAPIIVLTLWISALMMMSSYKIIMNNDKTILFSSTVSLLTIILLLCFSSSNILMFYLFFEASLLPTTALIILWGTQPERMQATFYFLMYTISASLPLLLSITMLWSKNKTLSLMNMNFNSPVPSKTLYIWWLISCIAFLVKMPMFSSHLWLPKAHVEAPVAGSMILAAILLKLGSYGLMRFSNMFPFATLNLMPLLTAISMTGACLTGMICLRQPDMKSLIAYSSVGHMGLLLAGMSSMSTWGMNGALAMTIAHGLSSSAMFTCANMMYELTHTRSMFITKGLLTFSPSMSLWLFLIVSANMAAPPTINLASEIMLLTSIMSSSSMNSMFIVTSSFLTGAYSFLLYTSTQHGNTTTLMLPLMPTMSRNSLTLMMHIMPILIIILNPNIMFFL